VAAIPSISEHLERQSVVLIEATIPPHMTIGQWCKRRRPRRQQLARCDHLHDTTTRYDPTEKQLSFLLVCPVCRTERLVDRIHYEPHFEPHPTAEPAGATVHQLPVRAREQGMRRAA
jgi:hypothetical protein